MESIEGYDANSLLGPPLASAYGYVYKIKLVLLYFVLYDVLLLYLTDDDDGSNTQRWCQEISDRGADASDEGANYFGTRALKPDRS